MLWDFHHFVPYVCISKTAAVCIISVKHVLLLSECCWNQYGRHVYVYAHLWETCMYWAIFFKYYCCFYLHITTRVATIQCADIMILPLLHHNTFHTVKWSPIIRLQFVSCNISIQQRQYADVTLYLFLFHYDFSDISINLLSQFSVHYRRHSLTQIHLLGHYVMNEFYWCTNQCLHFDHLIS